MYNINIADLTSILRDSGVIGLLTAILVGGSRGWWVFGRIYDEMREERDSWRAIALNAQGISAKAVSMAEQSVGVNR